MTELSGRIRHRVRLLPEGFPTGEERLQGSPGGNAPFEGAYWFDLRFEKGKLIMLKTEAKMAINIINAA